MFALNPSAHLLIRPTTSQPYLQFLNAPVGQSGRSPTRHLLSNGWEILPPFSFTIWITKSGLRALFHTRILSEQTAISYFAAPVSNATILTYISQRLCASQSTSVRTSPLYVNR